MRKKCILMFVTVMFFSVISCGMSSGTEDALAKSAKKASNGTDGFVKISGGSFMMGSPADEAEREADEVQHKVTVKSFYMSPTEVTQKEYKAVTGKSPSEKKGDNLPVTNVSWYDAVRYCNKLSETAGLTKVYTINGDKVIWDKSADGYRLPTEAEWEYAARAKTTTPFCFGDYVHDKEAIVIMHTGTITMLRETG